MSPGAAGDLGRVSVPPVVRCPRCLAGKGRAVSSPVSGGHGAEMGSAGRLSVGRFEIFVGKLKKVKNRSVRSCRVVCGPRQERTADGCEQIQSQGKHVVTLSLLCSPGCRNLKHRGFQAPGSQVKFEVIFMPTEVTNEVHVTKLLICNYVGW